MRFIPWVLLAAASGVLPPLLQAGGSGVRAWFVGGTVAQLPGKAEAKIELTDPDNFIIRAKKEQLAIPYSRIHTVEYGQRVNRRYAEAILISPVLLLSKSRKHFITLGYQDRDGKQQALVFRVSKGDIRPVLAGLEARSGRRVEYQDDNARNQGRD
jgi:hypothetical protein